MGAVQIDGAALGAAIVLSARRSFQVPRRRSRLIGADCREPQEEDGVHDISSRAIDAKAFVSARLSEMASALDGFPTAVLLDNCLTVEGGCDAVDRRA